MRDFWHLTEIDWLKELSDGEKQRLRNAAIRRDCAPGQMVFAPQRSPNSVYLLEDGLVRIYRLSEEGSETTFGYVTPGEVFGELAAFGDYPRESFAQAVRASRVWKVPREVFQALIQARPSLVVEITRQIGERLKRVESRVENLVFRDVRSRVAHILLELAQDFGLRRSEHIVLDVPITQAEIATLVGSTRQSVNASLRELEQEGLLGREGRLIVIVKEHELRRTADRPPFVSR